MSFENLRFCLLTKTGLSFIIVIVDKQVRRNTNTGARTMSTSRVDLSTGSWTVEGRIDTRSYDMETGKAISGTGEVYNCDCCGKDHEVWVYVSSKTEQAIVGTSCAKKATHMHNRELLGANYTTTKRNGISFYQSELAKFHKAS